MWWLPSNGHHSRRRHVYARLHYELRELCENLPDEALLLSAQTVAIVSLPACEMAQYAPRLGLASGEGLKAAAKLCLTKLNQCSRRRSAFIRNEQTGGTGGIVDQNSLCHPPRGAFLFGLMVTLVFVRPGPVLLGFGLSHRKHGRSARERRDEPFTTSSMLLGNDGSGCYPPL